VAASIHRWRTHGCSPRESCRSRRVPPCARPTACRASRSSLSQRRIRMIYRTAATSPARDLFGPWLPDPVVEEDEIEDVTLPLMLLLERLSARADYLFVA
jgi:hypothetical protein